MGITQQIGASSLIKPGVIDSAAARPASPYEGQVIFQKDTDQLLVWNGTAWVIPNSPAQNPQGLELVKTQTITGTPTSVTVSNAFSATYDNYRIVVNATGSSSQAIGCRLDGSSTAYAQFVIYGDLGANTLYGFQQSSGSEFRFVGGSSGAGNASVACFDLMNPFAAAYTRMPSGPYFESNSMGISNAEHRVATSYTGFIILCNAGTFTGGTISVYGYRK